MKDGFDYSQFKEYLTKFEDMTKSFDDWLNSFLLEQAQRCIARTKSRQRGLELIDTGFMINSWTIGNIRQVGGLLEVTVGNPAEYSSYVEYGHSTRNGGWVNGGFMFTVSLDEINRAMPTRFQNQFTQFLKEWGIE